MSLERTNYGLSNEHLFYNVSLVVYCEGKESDGATHDEMFWGRVFSAFGVKCVCKSKGSKTNIVPLARRAVEGDVKNIAFAMDRDYGDYHGFPILDTRVVYTYGYSWENDVLLSLNAVAVFSMFAAVANGDSVDQDLRAFTVAASESASRVTHMDISNALTTIALFDRGKPVSIFVGGGQDLRFDAEGIARTFVKISAEHEMANVNEEQHDWLRVFYGKACTRLIYQWFVDRSLAYSSRSKIPYDAFLRSCISGMVIDPETNIRDKYYRGAVSIFAS
ncbi:hypothetical protein Q9299_20865 [Gemmobacter fulvus]|uniref:hypothetical protein n=1 Tax=Gemmobacter fulvus TaxID=2840474 RepID=UPI00279699B6|nr:hypothetical protein [Gemmobacter fulvus]MDQ1850760.1 hypothetical protein [Gemmobacter fulvus]